MELTFHEIRHGTPEYFASADLRNALLRNPIGIPWTQDDIEDEKTCFHLICRQGPVLAACLMLKPLTSRQVRMRQLAVREHLQNRGIGKALVLFAEKFTLEKSFSEMVLHAREIAVGFYEKLGYVREGEPFIEVTLPHFLMHKSLK